MDDFIEILMQFKDLNIVLSFITAFILTYFSIPSIIKVANVKLLYDEPGERKSHTELIPTLGGVGIFAGFLIAITYWSDFEFCWHLQYVIAASVVIFIIGIKDDIIALSPLKKAAGQILAAYILTYSGMVRITSFYGIFGIYELHPFISILFSMFTILVIINAFNLIDGINGLAASLGIIACLTFGIWFLFNKSEYQYAVQHSIMVFSLAGALLAFLRYNTTPAQIFMGDTGSLLIGLVMSVTAIEFIEYNGGLEPHDRMISFPMVAIGIMFIPLFDLLRVFTIRLLKRRSPFKPDRTHIHHLLLDIGFSHSQATFILSAVAVFFIIVAFAIRNFSNYIVGTVLFLLGLILWYIPILLKKIKQPNNKT